VAPEAAPVKRWIRLGAVVVAIVAMVVAIVVLQNRDPSTASDAEASGPVTAFDDSERVTLLENPRDEIERILIEGDQVDLTIERTGEGEFLPLYEYDVEFDQQPVNRIVSAAASLTSRRVIGEIEDRSAYGLDDPAATVTVERTDGERRRLVIGGMTPAQDAYYVMRDDDEKVYSVFSTWVRPFFTTLDSMRVRTIPQIDFEQLGRIEIGTLAGRTIRVEQVPEWDQDPELGFSRFAVYEPFSRRFQVNTNWLEELGTALESLRIGRFVDDAPSDLDRYGLAPPRARIDISDEETTLEVLVGDETEGGRFATFPGTPSVFVLAGTDPIVDVRPYDTISPFVLIVNIDLIDSFTVASGGETYTGRIERTVVSESDDEEVEETYFLNDQPVDEELFKDLYQWAIGLQLDAEIQADEIPTRTDLASREPIATITYNLNNGTEPLSVSFVPQNANFAAAVRDGETQFLISRAKLRRMVDAFAEAAEEL
jgi:hypothetical protein